MSLQQVIVSTSGPMLTQTTSSGCGPVSKNRVICLTINGPPRNQRAWIPFLE